MIIHEGSNPLERVIERAVETTEQRQIARDRSSRGNAARKPFTFVTDDGRTAHVAMTEIDTTEDPFAVTKP